jgi:hypothetical protein
VTLPGEAVDKVRNVGIAIKAAAQDGNCIVM